jgi:UDP-N-acetylmuramoyl-L-alanyl-D-glutamate--2,6-diaminopimelate ligase
MIKKFIPRTAMRGYHLFLGSFASVLYGKPSNDLIVIGITGTNGKSTTGDILAAIFEQAGHRVGLTSTVKFKIAEEVQLNDKKMTMLGRFALQRLINKMVKAGCEYAIIETTSQGIEQFRHVGVNYDMAVFTNLTPEHIEAHGSFENYKQAKGKLFSHLLSKPHKYIHGHKISKVSVVNADDDHADFFLGFAADWKYAYGMHQTKMNVTNVQAESVHLGRTVQFEVNGALIEASLPGEFNIYNMLAAITVARHYNISWQNIQLALKNFSGVAGRLEFIDEKQPFEVIVDYAHEPQAMSALYKVVKTLRPRRVIHVFGSCGGGRDAARRPVLGRMAAEFVDELIITNEDPYDEDPQKIIDAVAAGAFEVLGRDAKNIHLILDRKQAIHYALSIAQPQDLVLITGKGSEQAIAVGDKLLPWDDRQIVRNYLKK